MLQQTDSAASIAAKSSPGLVYTAWVYLVGLPIEKWVSAAALVFTLLQILFLIKDRMKKRRHKRGAE